LNSSFKQKVGELTYGQSSELDGENLGGFSMDVLGKEDERRQAQRAVVLLSGSAATVDALDREACIVRNVSDDGALLQVHAPERIPDEVLLVIDGDHTRKPARVVRRDDHTVAVRFISNGSEEDSGDWIFPPMQESA
jgi:hypothetical protein